MPNPLKQLLALLEISALIGFSIEFLQQLLGSAQPSVVDHGHLNGHDGAILLELTMKIDGQPDQHYKAGDPFQAREPFDGANSLHR